MEVKEILSHLGEVEFEGETYLLISRAPNLEAANPSILFYAAINSRAKFPAPVVIVPVPPVSQMEEG